MRNIIVTGGAGMIGSELVFQLLQRGDRVAVLDDFTRGRIENLGRAGDAHGERLSIVVGNVMEERTWEALADEHGTEWDEIYHLAARIGGVGKMYECPFDQAINAPADWRTIEAAMDLQARLLYASSACVYPKRLQTASMGTYLLAEEEAIPAEPESLYGMLKLAGEEMVRAAAQQYGLEAVCVRMFNAVGPEFCDLESRHVIPALVGKLLGGDAILEVWGDGTAERSFLDCRDAARALMLSMDKGDRNGAALNIGDDRRYSIQHVAERCIALVTPEARIQYDDSRPAGVHTRAANADAMKRLGWQIEHGLDDMIRYVAEVLRG